MLYAPFAWPVIAGNVTIPAKGINLHSAYVQSKLADNPRQRGASCSQPVSNDTECYSLSVGKKVCIAFPLYIITPSHQIAALSSDSLDRPAFHQGKGWGFQRVLPTNSQALRLQMFTADVSIISTNQDLNSSFPPSFLPWCFGFGSFQSPLCAKANHFRKPTEPQLELPEKPHVCMHTHTYMHTHKPSIVTSFPAWLLHRTDQMCAYGSWSFWNAYFTIIISLDNYCL